MSDLIANKEQSLSRSTRHFLRSHLLKKRTWNKDPLWVCQP